MDFVLALAWVVLVLDYGLCLKCYKCSSKESSACTAKKVGKEVPTVECGKDDEGDVGAYLTKKIDKLERPLTPVAGGNYSCIFLNFEPKGLVLRSCMQDVEDMTKFKIAPLCSAVVTALGVTMKSMALGLFSKSKPTSEPMTCLDCAIDLCNAPVTGHAASLALAAAAAAAAAFAYFGCQ